MQATPYALMGEQFVPLNEANVSIMTHALHYGTTCFEGIRGNWNPDSQTLFVFRMRDHYERLERGSKMLLMGMPFSVDKACELTAELLKTCGYREDVYIRPIVYKSSEKIANLNLHDLESQIAVVVIPFGNYIDGSKPIKCMTSSWRRPEDYMIPTRVKLSALYTISILAKSEAIAGGFEEAILLNNAGLVSEGSGENIFLVKNGVIHTPRTSDDCLVGITRDSAIRLSEEELDMEVIERPIQRSELYLADEIFLTGTAAHITPVGSLDNRLVADGSLGPVTMKLQKLYKDAIYGRDENRLDWCFPVEIDRRDG